VDEQNWIFLTRTQAIDAIKLDFLQYGPQPRLCRELCPLIPNCRVKIIKQGKNTGAWINSGQNNQLLELDDTDLCQYVSKALETVEYPLTVLSDICSLVFETRACKGEGTGKNRRGIWIKHNMDRFACSQCGNCCRNLGYETECTKEDYDKWQDSGQKDILDRVMVITSPETPDQYRIWMDPVTRTLDPTCPWLSPAPQKDRFFCQIQENKPAICREYPFTRKHAVMTECQGKFSPSDFHKN